jgi:hypothetical protein
MQSKQSKECSVFSCHKTWSNLDRPVLYQTKLQVNRDVIKIDIVTIEHNPNRLIISGHKIHIILIKHQTVMILIKTEYA